MALIQVMSRAPDAGTQKKKKSHKNILPPCDIVRPTGGKSRAYGGISTLQSIPTQDARGLQA